MVVAVESEGESRWRRSRWVVVTKRKRKQRRRKKGW
jgi:hypothetical protein